jgi:hypothetical protein
MDDGSSRVTVYDADGSRTWSSTITTYDASGRRTSSTQYFDNGERAERTYFPDQNPNAFSESYFYADGHGAGGRVEFDGHTSRLNIGGNDMAGEFVGSPRDLWLQVGVTYYFEEPEGIVIVGPIEGPFGPSEGW